MAQRKERTMRKVVIRLVTSGLEWTEELNEDQVALYVSGVTNARTTVVTGLEFLEEVSA
jgi:hypothetical protein